MRRSRLALLLVLGMLAALLPLGVAPAAATTGDLVITGVVDGPLPGGIPKAIELYAVNNIGDLSIYGVGAANNGGGTDGEEFTLSGSATAGQFLYVALEAIEFNNFFGFAPDYVSGSAASINGDDAIELFRNGSVVDVFGEIDAVPGAWGYQDGWAYRVDGSGWDGTTFTIGNWVFSGPNALDGETTNGTATTPFPLASYSTVVSGPTILINEVDADQTSTDSAEFVELYDGGAGNTDLTGLSIVLYNGSDDASYLAFDLDGQSTDGAGYFVLCGNAANTANCDLDVSPNTNLVQNGADAVALVEGDAVNFPNDTPVSATGLLDMVVYDTSDGDDAGLLAFVTGPQVNENGRAAGTSHSNQRCPNGSGGALNTTSYAQFVPTPGEANVCEDPAQLVFIHEVQGASAASPLVGQTVIVEGIVVGDFQDDVGANGDLNGFHVQEEDADADADAATSEGIFVFQGSNPAVDVAIGDQVRVEGSVSEFNGLTEITSFSGVTVLSAGNAPPTPASLTLPVDAVTDLEAYEGMSVIFGQDLVITEYFNYDRFGQIVLSSERHLQPTAVLEPGSPDAADAADLILRDRIILDDGLTSQNPQVTRHPNGAPFSLTNLFSGGDTVTDAVGVMDFAFGAYAIQPTGPASHADANPREAAPDDVGGDVTVASFNVLNYYTTLDESGAECFPSGTRSDCRGADNAGELARQRAKIIVALSEIDADVVGLIEIENNVNDDAVIDLVSGLNDAVGAGTYDYVPAGTTGTDTIKVAFIYKPGVVSLAGAHAILDSAAFLDPANTGVDRNRAALAQTFTENVTGESFTAVVNHFKSKSGSEIDNFPNGICVDGDPGNDIPDCDQLDGQAYFNHTRTLAAQVLSDWLATDPTGSGDPDVLVIGDLNAYDKEDPIDVMAGNGYTDLVHEYQGEAAYSFVFNGQIGYLDYGMANEALLPAVTGTTVWHLNSDEPDLLDYDTSFKSSGQAAIFDGTSPFRSSDHDPVIIGLNLANPMGDKAVVAAVLAALLPTGDNNTDKQLNKAIDNIDASLNSAWWTSDQTITDKKVFDNERQAVAQLDLIVDGGGPAAEAALDAILILVNADRQLAQIELIAAIDRGGNASKIAGAQQAMADAAAYASSGLYVDAINAYKAAWDAAKKA